MRGSVPQRGFPGSSGNVRIGIDLGGTKTEGVLLDAEGNVCARERRPTPSTQGYAGIVAQVVALARALERAAERTCRVGVGIPGTVDTASGLVKNANTNALIGEPLAADLSDALDREVRVANDANCFAIAEAQAGAGRGYRVVFGVILGTGCGSGLVIDGQVHGGRHGIAGEWGHSPIEDRQSDPAPATLCYCGQLGCLETRVSGPAFERDYARLVGLDAASVGAPEIVSRAHAGEAVAIQVVERYLGFLAEGLARVFHIVDPDVVVLGGGMSKMDLLYERLPKAVESVLFNPTLDAPILRNELGDSAGVFGAAWLWNA